MNAARFGQDSKPITKTEPFQTKPIQPLFRFNFQLDPKKNQHPQNRPWRKRANELKD